MHAASAAASLDWLTTAKAHAEEWPILVQRLSGRLELTRETDPVGIELALQKILPESDWSFASTALIWHGRRVCVARNPRCDACGIRSDCPFPKRR